MGWLLVVLALHPAVLERQGDCRNPPALGQLVPSGLDRLLGLVRFVRGQNKVRLGVVPGGGGDASKELRPAVKIALGCVCCDGQHSRAGRVSSVGGQTFLVALLNNNILHVLGVVSIPVFRVEPHGFRAFGPRVAACPPGVKVRLSNLVTV